MIESEIFVKLRPIKDEVLRLRLEGKLTYEAFDGLFEQAKVICATCPRILESLILRAPSDWLLVKITGPIDALSHPSRVEELEQPYD
jgi:hypothetical protein